MKLRQVKTEWGVEERGRKRYREKWIKRVGGQMYVRIKTAQVEKNDQWRNPSL